MDNETDEKLEKSKEDVIKLCICPMCPSWVECGEQPGFCVASIGKSKCIKEEKGCVCGPCPVTPMFGLTKEYYCTKGSEKEQRK